MVSIIRPTSKSPSSTRSTPTDASAVLNRTGSCCCAAYARANSPARTGSRLLAMKPMAVVCHSGRSGKRWPPTARRISCQRSVRNGNVSVASATAASSSSGSARRRWPTSSCGSMSCSAHPSSASVTASPTTHAQREPRDVLGGRVEGGGNEQGPDVHDRQGILRRRIPHGNELLQRRGPDAGLHQPLVRRPRAGEVGRLGGGAGRGGRGGRGRRGRDGGAGRMRRSRRAQAPDPLDQRSERCGERVFVAGVRSGKQVPDLAQLGGERRGVA